MTDHDYWLEDMQAMKKRKKPNYPLRRILFAIAVVALIVTSTLMLTWHDGDTTAALMVEGVYIATALWLIVRFAPRDSPTKQTNWDVFADIHVHSCRLAGTITEYRQTTNPPRRLHTPFCRGFGWATVRPSTDSNLFSLYQKRRHSGACKPFQVRLTAFSHRRPRHRP